MNDEQTRFVLSCRDPKAPAPVLTSVGAQGRLDAVLFELTLRQTYRNTSDQLLEVVYTFPLPPRAVLLGFASELNGERQDGVIVAKHEAEDRYEKSLEEGDAPVMLEADSDGLHTANIGNLKPGDEVVLEARFAQLLSFEQGRLRVAIPTTIAPRYGNAERAGLQPQQVPQASLDAEYPLTLSLTIGAALAGARVECPTHRMAVSQDTNGNARLELTPGAKLDRDVVVVVTPDEPRPSLLVRAHDSFDPTSAVTMMAALQLPSSAPRESVALKLLVDCSGSMNGDSMASARAALRGVIAGLTERDQLSLTRFGSTVEPLWASAKPVPKALGQLQRLVDGMQADLGGTEMEAALNAVFKLRASTGQVGGDVLLITDGEIWQVDDVVAAARRSGHRVFAIGVGASPAEGVLRSLAEATGGACEFATPGEALEKAAKRMLDRMRQPVYANARIDWGHMPIWAAGPAPGLFGGDTVIALAGFAQAVVPSAVRLLADDAAGTTRELARVEADAPCPGDGLPRVAAARRVVLSNKADALALAMKYQLMSPQTNCILVHRRVETDKATEPANLHRVSSMLAAGWGGMGSIDGLDAHFSLAVQDAPNAVSDSFGAFRNPFSDIFGSRDFIPVGAVKPPPASLATLARYVTQYLASGRSLGDLPAQCEALSVHAEARHVLDEAVQLGLSPAQAWLLLAHWVNVRVDGLADADQQQLLEPFLAAIDPELVASVVSLYERTLGARPLHGWPQSRSERLRLALGRP